MARFLGLENTIVSNLNIIKSFFHYKKFFYMVILLFCVIIIFLFLIVLHIQSVCFLLHTPLKWIRYLNKQYIWLYPDDN